MFPGGKKERNKISRIDGGGIGIDIKGDLENEKRRSCKEEYLVSL